MPKNKNKNKGGAKTPLKSAEKQEEIRSLFHPITGKRDFPKRQGDRIMEVPEPNRGGWVDYNGQTVDTIDLGDKESEKLDLPPDPKDVDNSNNQDGANGSANSGDSKDCLLYTSPSPRD